MPATQQWIDWAKERTLADLGSGLATSNRTLFIYYSALVTRRLRDLELPAGTPGSWSGVDELANADHYWFSRYVIFTAACLGHTPIGVASARRSPTLRLILPIIRSLGRRESPHAGSPPRSRADSHARRRHERDSPTTDPFAWVADGIEQIDLAVRGAGDVLAAGTAAMVAGGAAILWSALIPLWATYKSIAVGVDLPWLIPGNDGFDGAPSSDASTEQMGWAYVGINDAINDDFNFCWQWFGSPTLSDVQPEGFDDDTLLHNLPVGASPAVGA
jgi:hypothetical protein